MFNIKEWISEFMERYFMELAKENISITLRPHPNESFLYFKNLSSKYPHISQFQEPSCESSYNALINSDVVLSGTSMCLYEAVAFGKVSVSLKRYRGMTVPDHVRFVESPLQLLNLLRELKNVADYELVIKEYLAGFREEALRKFI
jgi:hypothetical protein